MKFRQSAPAVLIGAVIVVIATVSIASNLISHRMAASFEETQFALMGQIMQSKLSGAEGKAMAAAEGLASMPAVVKAFSEQDREALLTASQGTFKVMHEKHGVSQAQFHLAPALSFLRLHNPEKFDDDQSKFRQMVVEVNRTNGIRKGIEVTTSGIGIFGTLPLADNTGQVLGSFEMAMEFGPLLDELKKAYGFELALFINEKILHDTATSLKGDIFNEQNRVGPYIKFYSTHPELLRRLVDSGDINITEESHYLRDANGVPHGVLLQPVYNYAKKQIGVVAMARDFSATRSADGQAIVWQTLLGVLSAMLLAGVVLIVLRGLVTRPMAVLNERMAALADGTHARDLPGAETWCKEMRALAQNCERIATQADSNKSGSGDAS
ncbi:MAG: hypothetical protein IPN53_09365 [Comamonadaceae bacterium]|nr:hypothetical protein [Comamonadaceae bacterium]